MSKLYTLGMAKEPQILFSGRHFTKLCPRAGLTIPFNKMAKDKNNLKATNVSKFWLLKDNEGPALVGCVDEKIKNRLEKLYNSKAVEYTSATFKPNSEQLQHMEIKSLPENVCISGAHDCFYIFSEANGEQIDEKLCKEDFSPLRFNL